MQNTLELLCSVSYIVKKSYGTANTTVTSLGDLMNFFLLRLNGVILSNFPEHLKSWMS